jgi:hypothetical protein
VFLSVNNRFAGTTMDTEAFNSRVRAWAKAWADHLKAKGLQPAQLGLLLVDEPRTPEHDDTIVAWATAINAAGTGIVIWEDPVYSDPTLGRPEMYEVSDILCPNRPMWMSAGKKFADFYLDQQNKGRVLQLYSCTGPSTLLDPYSYYRLQAWHCWQIGATGSFFWAFGDNSRSSSWNEYAGTQGPYTPLFLDDETVTPAKQMEAIRESVQDYEYFVMLQKAVNQAKSENVPQQDLEEAESLLRTAADDVLAGERPEALMWHQPKNRTRADAVRIRILEALTRLSAQP